MSAAVKFKKIVPPKLDVAAMRAALHAGMVEVGGEIDNDFQKTVTTWNTKPAFTVVLKDGRKAITATVQTADKIYAYVSLGTPPHIIRPKRRGGVLKFKGGYRAKTVPGFVGSVAGGPRGEDVYTTVVYHPGTEARDFEAAEAEDFEDKFVEIIEAALAQAAAESGHGL
jgi:hypothetical protein